MPAVSVGLVNSSLVVNQNSGEGLGDTIRVPCGFPERCAQLLLVLSMSTALMACTL